MDVIAVIALKERANRVLVRKVRKRATVARGRNVVLVQKVIVAHVPNAALVRKAKAHVPIVARAPKVSKADDQSVLLVRKGKVVIVVLVQKVRALAPKVIAVDVAAVAEVVAGEVTVRRAVVEKVRPRTLQPREIVDRVRCLGARVAHGLFRAARFPG